MSFHLDEGRIGQARQAAGDFGFAHAGGADHENVLGRDFGAQLFRHLLPAPAVAQGNGDGAFGILLADDVAVQLGDDFLRGHGRHGKACGQEVKRSGFGSERGADSETRKSLWRACLLDVTLWNQEQIQSVSMVCCMLV